MNPTGPRSRQQSPPEAAPPSPHRRERRAFRTGLIVSAVLHLVLLALYPALVDIPGLRGPEERAPDEDPVLDGTEIVAIQEMLDEPDVAEPEAVPDPVEVVETEEEPAEEPEEPAEEPGDEPDPADDPEEDPGPSVAERLQPQMVDPRLWAPVDSQHVELSDVERAELLFRGMIESWNDSVAVAAALREDARDWTYTDSDGQRWGISPGRLHLGDFSIPLPFEFSAPPGQWEETMDRQWVLEDLARGREAAIIRETWAERAREIRERMESERGGASADGTDGG